MPLAVGMRLGPYEILGLVGSGGMGEVYRARDPRLGREVALKVLPEGLTSNPDRLRRFEREARAVAALNHPNILTVHDVGGDAGRPFVVTELLEGETLGERLRKGALSLREAVETAVHIAQGVAAAHAKTIAHRDLKPANVFLTTDGRVKILDFGLARWEGLGPEETTASVATDPGTRLGTVGYMSPEQVRGGRGDHRSDIFSFGVLLYEMVSGRHPFRRTTGVETQAAILREEPLALSGLGLPEALERVMLRCLEKRPEDRFHSAHDLALALQSITGAPLTPLPLQGAGVSEPGPYPGLRPFTEELKESFFGREAEVAALWEKLQRRKLLSLIGPSGVGKTSFVRAGLVPARPSGWRCVTATPGRRPFASLARALVPEFASDTEALQELVGFDDPDVAVRLVGRWRRRHAGVLVVVDQLEELFTLHGAEVQAAFAALLWRLCDEADVHVLLSLRDDFFFACHAHPALAEVFTEVTPLGPLAGEALRRALVEPAKREEYRFEDDALVDEMCGAVEGERGALPLLAFCAAELWERRDRERKLLTRAACEEIGGVAGALAQHAEATLERIGAERQGMVREIFRNLVTAQGTRAVIDREELLSALPDRTAAEEVLGQLIEARLLTSYEVESGEGQPSHHRIEIVHESLLKAWPRLVRWQTQDEEGAQLRDQLKQAARLWDDKGRAADLLWSGTSFREYELWRERYPGTLTALEEGFAKAMREKARRRKRLLTAAVASVIVALAGVAIAVSVSRAQAARALNAAREQALRAEASRLVALGRLELETDPTAALAYARKSLEVHDGAEARRLALESLWRGPVATFLPIPKSDQCIWVSTSPDGQWLACSNWGNVITLFSADGKTTRVLSNNRNAAAGRAVRFSDDSRRLATFAPGDPETVVWSVDGQEVARLRPGGYPRSFVGDALVLLQEPREGQKAFEYVVHRIGSPEVRSLGQGGSRWDIDLARARLVYWKDRAVFSRPLGPGAPARAEVKIGEHESRVTDVSFYDGTGWIISVDERSEAHVWDGGSHRLLRTLRGLEPDRLFGAPIPDARGTLLAWHSLRETAFPVWDLAGPPDAEPLLLHKSEVAGDAGNGAFTSDGRWLVTALQFKVAFWPLQMPWPRVLRVGGTVAFTPDSKRIVSCGDPTRVYPLTPDAPAARPITFEGRAPVCYGLAMEPAGRHVLLAAPVLALLLAPLDGGEPQALVRVPPTESICAAALDAAGRWAATAACYAPDPKDRVLHVVDRRTGNARAFPLPGSTGAEAWSGNVLGLHFVADGRLISAGTAGLYRWDPETGTNESLHLTLCGPMDGSIDGRWLVVGCKGAEPATDAGSGRAKEAPQPPYGLLVIDSSTGDWKKIDSHGSDIWSVTMSPSGDVIATGDSSGTVRVGRRDGSEPHLLVGGGGRVDSLAFSPDGRWIASASGGEIRLWPMPDLSKPPLHTLPHDALLAKLASLTNVRVVEDPASATGYRLGIAPFPGWKDVPTW
jgi:WD40 repeat protein